MMKHFRIPHFLTLLVAGVCLAAPSSSYADRKIKIRRDLDGDGHYNTKTIRVGDRHHRGYNRGYYGHRGYGYGYGYGHRGYGYGYGRSYYRRPSVGLSFFSSPAYYYSSPSYYTTRRYTTYRSSPGYAGSYESELSVEVQQALKRRGYYSGAIDGDIGPGSRSAIRAYQADRGLSVTGRIDSSLLRALGIG